MERSNKLYLGILFIIKGKSKTLMLYKRLADLKDLFKFPIEKYK
jgi:hypothetical protein